MVRWINVESCEVRSGWRIDDRPGELQEAGSSAGAIRRLLISIKTVFRASEVANLTSRIIRVPTSRRRQQKVAILPARDHTSSGPRCSEPKAEVRGRSTKASTYSFSSQREAGASPEWPVAKADPVRLLAGPGSRLCFVSASETSSTFVVRACEGPCGMIERAGVRPATCW